MLNIFPTAEEIKILQYERFHHPHPHVQQKMDVILLKSFGLSHQMIAEIVGICTNTLRTYIEEYKEGGISRLREIRFYQPESKLNEFKSTLESHFAKHPPATVKEAASEIEKITGIKRKLTQVKKFLYSIGLARRKTGSIPSKADPDKQEIFEKEELAPRLEEARNGVRILYFLDAAHFVHAPFLGYLWCFVRVFLKAPSGRYRFNVLGALNAVTHKLLMVTNNAYINAQSVCELIKLIAESHKNTAITLVLDNARYQKCALVQVLAKSLGIELLYLPPYSPNLNLIERIWKFTKRHCLNSKYYENFASFSAAISTFLGQMNTTHADELQTLLTHNFQKFELNSTDKAKAKPIPTDKQIRSQTPLQQCHTISRSEARRVHTSRYYKQKMPNSIPCGLKNTEADTSALAA